jgi:hypothetical protein
MMLRKYPKTLKSIHGLSVAITGTCWKRQAKLASLIRKKGGSLAANYAVKSSTDVLVRGKSEFWKHKTYGRKEAKAAQIIQNGNRLLVIPDDEFRKLIERDQFLKFLKGNISVQQPILF